MKNIVDQDVDWTIVLGRGLCCMCALSHQSDGIISYLDDKNTQKTWLFKLELEIISYHKHIFFFFQIFHYFKGD